MARTRRQTILITDAPEDPEKELRRREIRYVSMMLLRAVCLIGAAVLVTAKPPLWGLWVGVCLVAMVLLPWLAVILANDRPAKSRDERRHPQPQAHPQLTLPQKIDNVIDDQP